MEAHSIKVIKFMPSQLLADFTCSNALMETKLSDTRKY